MTAGKRLFDIVLALLLAFPVVPLTALVALAVLIVDGRPILYVSERMRSPDRAFGLVKFRTMRSDPDDSGVTGGGKAERITRTGRWLRRTRLDELPQLWNILRGDMSFVGPRPPLRTYAERFPDLYAEVLTCRPGVTGLATLIFRDHEARLLAACTTVGETDAVYARRCVPRKARIDLIYRTNRSLALDLWIIGRTLGQLIRPRQASAARGR